MTKEIKLPGGIVTLVDDTAYLRLSKYTWHISYTAGKAMYVRRFETDPHTKKRGCIYMHRVIAHPQDTTMVVLHLNGNTLDNRRKNLCACTRSQAALHREKSAKVMERQLARDALDIFEYKGVSKFKDKYTSRITFQGTTHYLGSFDTPQAAHQAYLAAKASLLTTGTLPPAK